MGWEERNGRMYYYRKLRIGQTVVSDYVGAGTLAELIAQKDAYGRINARMRRVEETQTIEDDLGIDRELNQIDDLVRALTYSVLLDHGYHTHNGQWRNRRDVR